jgi:hypothetical protein
MHALTAPTRLQGFKPRPLVSYPCALRSRILDFVNLVSEMLGLDGGDKQPKGPLV